MAAGGVASALPQLVARRVGAQRMTGTAQASGAECWHFSEQIFAAAHDGFAFVERGEHLVKGKQESLKVFQLVGAST
jgi:hypothetical protein